MTYLLVGLAAFAILVAVAAIIVLGRAREFRRLLVDGVEVTGVVVEKSGAGDRGPTGKGFGIRYAFRDAAGRERVARAVVTPARYEALAEGGPIAVVHARAKSSVSAPKWIVEEAQARHEARRR